ncbi:MAG: phosphoenolpyruvate--protein phosphotransferase [Deltaproteobacteria bacterium]|nr:phosphoenolpyruvate--protein phosphotransferase [Deltaproteobacteria bacterium]
MVSEKTRIDEDTCFVGIGVSPGIAIGEVFFLSRAREPGVSRPIPADRVAAEIALFREAVALSKKQLLEAKGRIIDKRMHKHLFIIDAHLLILDDKMFLNDTVARIRDEQLNAEGAVKSTLKKFQKLFDSIQDEYLRDRKADLDSVGDRLIRNLRGEAIRSVTEIREKTILAAHDLSPADAMQIDRDRVFGVIADQGGRTSHTAILARSLGIPAVFGLGNFSSLVPNGVAVIIDGGSGMVIVNPSDATFKEYLAKKQALEYSEIQLARFRDLPTVTTDGQRIRLRANIEFPLETAAALRQGAEGVGLYRTEIMFLGRNTLPDEEDQLRELREVVAGMAPHPVIIRTLDIGGEKILPELSPHREANPAMGLRAVRFSLRETALFKCQLRAILRASHYGRAAVMFPMISSLPEVRACRSCLEEAMAELRQEGIPFDPGIPVGVMVEIPAAVMIADLLAAEADFFSVGTNDLIQYGLAVDRGNQSVAYLYQPLHPAVLRMLRQIARCSRQAGIAAAVCGEMAGDPLYAPVLIGLGFEELSMNAHSIPVVKRVIRDFSLREVQELAAALERFETAEKSREFLEQEMRRRFPDLFEIFRM